MTVPVTKFKGLDAASACRHCLIERVRAASRESRLAFLFPHAVQRLESRC